MRSTGILVTNTSPPWVMNVDVMTKRTASSRVMMKRVISGSVIVTGPPAAICRLNSGITEPRESRTLPNRVDANMGPSERRMALLADMSRSAMSLEVPITLVGLTALSDEVNNTRLTLFMLAASITFWLPMIFV